MKRRSTSIVLLVLLAVATLALLTACPKQEKGASTGPAETATQPQPVQPVSPPEAPAPPEEVAGDEAEPESLAGPEPEPEAPPTGAALNFDGYQSLTFGVSKADALANLPFNLRAEDGKAQSDFAVDGDEAYLFKVPYADFDLLEPVEEAKAESFGVVVGFWDGKFEHFTIITPRKHLGRMSWSNIITKFSDEYGPPAGVSPEEDGSVTMSWVDAKGRALSLMEPPPTDPDALYQITYESDTWLALFAQ